jgi:hypothetical protein
MGNGRKCRRGAVDQCTNATGFDVIASEIEFYLAQFLPTTTLQS